MLPRLVLAAIIQVAIGVSPHAKEWPLRVTQDSLSVDRHLSLVQLKTASFASNINATGSSNDMQLATENDQSDRRNAEYLRARGIDIVEDAPMELVVATYESDLCPVTYLARSIGKFDPHAKVLGNVHLIWVSSEPLDVYQKQMDTVVRGFGHSRNVSVRDMSLSQRNLGWFVQQASKLEASKSVRSKHYLVLDSKNIFLQPITRDTFVNQIGRPRVSKRFHLNNTPWVETWYNGSSKLLNVSLPRDILLPNSITPVILNTEQVKNMVNTIESKHPRLTDAFIPSAGALVATRNTSVEMPTEFTSYFTWMYDLAKDDVWTNTTEFKVFTLWEKAPWFNFSTKSITQHYLARLTSIKDGISFPEVFGIHRSLWGKLAAPGRTELAQLVYGIFKNVGITEESDGEQLRSACSITPQSSELVKLEGDVALKHHDALGEDKTVDSIRQLLVQKFCPAKVPQIQAFPNLYGYARQLLGLDAADYNQTNIETVAKVTSIATSAPGGWSLRFGTNQKRTISYLGRFKCASENLTCAGQHWRDRLNISEDSNDFIETGLWKQETEESKNSYNMRLNESEQVFMIEREPMSHFASGYNEFIFRMSDAFKGIGDPPLPDNCTLSGHMKELSALPADSVEAFHTVIRQLLDWHTLTSEEASCWRYRAGITHVFLQSGSLHRLQRNAANVAERLVNVDIVNASAMIRAINSQVDEAASSTEDFVPDCTKHESSNDPVGSYATAKRTIADPKDLHVDALCFLSVLDYACFPEYLVDGSRCAQTYIKHLAALQSLNDIQEAAASVSLLSASEEEHKPAVAMGERAPLRLATLKTGRSCSTTLNKQIMQASSAYKWTFAHEVLVPRFWMNRTNEEIDHEVDAQLMPASSCNGTTAACGWSINLGTTPLEGLNVFADSYYWQTIADVIDQHDMKVLILSRRDSFKWAVSSAYAMELKTVMSASEEFKALPVTSPLTCDAFDQAGCSEEQMRWIERHPISLDLEFVEAKSKKHPQVEKTFDDLQRNLLNKRKNLEIMRIHMEDLASNETWDALGKFLGIHVDQPELASTHLPYSSVISNYPEVVEFAHKSGYDFE